jgi:hypothetical protein
MHQGAACLCGRVSLPLPDDACFCSWEVDSTASGSAIRTERFPVRAVII